MDVFSRRTALRLLTLPVFELVGQQPIPGPANEGMASRGLKSRPHRKGSGLPFHSRFTDVAARAGLNAPVISGHPKRADYVIEAMGCGCAFFDYDRSVVQR